MKILQINTVVNTGSTGRIAEEIGQAIQKIGWKSYIAYGRNSRPSMSDIIRIGNDWDNKLHAIETRLLDRHGLGSRRATKRFIEQIKKIQPDLIHLHNIHGYYLNYPLLFEYLASIDIPIVWTLHDCWSFTGHCSHFTLIKCEKWKTQCFKCPQLKSYPTSLFYDRSHKNYSLKKYHFNNIQNLTLVSVSDWLCCLSKQSFINASKKIVINNGIDLKTFQIKQNHLTIDKYKLHGKFVMIAAATAWSDSKGLSDYIRLSASLKEDEQLILVGLSEDQLKSLPKTILGLPRTESVGELVDLYNVADLCLNLSYQETFGLTTVEAMACGTPGIVYNATASPELITSETGLIVTTGDIESVLHAIREVKVKGKQFYSQACRERAEKFYSKEDRYQEYIDLYKSLVKK